METEINPRGVPTLQFDPDSHPHSTLKAFNQFIEQYEFRYDAQFPEVQKHVLDAGVEKWKAANGNPDNVTVAQKQAVKDDIRSRDKVRKLLGFFASHRLQQDWKAAEPIATNRDCTWDHFKTQMRAYYKPTENTTLRNYEFRHLFQKPRETFSTFCNRVENEGRECTFCDCNATSDCTSTKTAVRDQIVIGTESEKIKEQALRKSWDLDTLRKEGMKIESAAKGEESISAGAVNKIGSYSFSNIRKQKEDQKHNNSGLTPSSKKCYRCGDPFTRSHLQTCSARNHKCKNCKKIGHLTEVCKKPAGAVRMVDDQPQEEKEQLSESEEVYEMNVWAVNTKGKRKFRAKPRPNTGAEFKYRLVINNKLVLLLVDTGAMICVCGEKQAAAWGISHLMQPSNVKIHPYQSKPIRVKGVITCGVTFNDRTVPVRFHVLPGSCTPILSGKKAVQLGIITMAEKSGEDNVFNPVQMIDVDASENGGKEFTSHIKDIIQKYPTNFSGLGKLQNHVVKLYADQSVKPVAVPPRIIPYHLQARFNEALQKMEEDDVIEKHPIDEPSPWVSCPVIVPKPDGSLRITLDARNVNKAIQSNNHPIPRCTDIKAQLAGAKYFSKLDFKSAFWQLEIDPKSRGYTVFYGPDNVLYRYKRLNGIKISSRGT